MAGDSASKQSGSGSVTGEGTVTRISADMIKPFNGDGDVIAWLKKVELVSRLTGVKDEALFIPLYLEGGALAVYMEMTSADQSSASAVKENLKRAFSDSMFISYSKLMGYKWTGEPVDVFSNELRRLVGLAGFQGEAGGHLVKLAFVAGFPDDVSLELQQIDGVERADMSVLLTRARILVSNRSGLGVAAMTIREDMGRKLMQENVSESRSKFPNDKVFSIKCFRCNGPHMIINCPEKPEKRFICFNCGGEGHMAARCNVKQSSGNA